MSLEFDGEGPKEPDIRDKYRALFSTGLGIDVLDDIMKLCGFGELIEVNNPAMVARHNLAVAILSKCLGSESKDGVRTVVQSMLGFGRTAR